jgi:hypothetical protein
MTVTVRAVEDAADKAAFVDLAYALNRGDPNWVPPLKTEVHGLLDPRTNPWFDHGEARLFLAERGGEPVGRISAQVDALVQQHMGAGTGQWGMLEAADAETAAALLHRAESWLRGRDMSRALGPFSLSIWDEPGLLIEGFDHPPTVMMGHNSPAYQGWVEAAGHSKAKDLHVYRVDVSKPFPPLIRRLVDSGHANPRIRMRHAEKARFEEEAKVILGLLNDAWSDNWGFVPLTERETAFAGRKLKPIVWDELIRIAELDTGTGWEPVAFMMTLPNINDYIADLGGRLFPLGWAKLLWRLRSPRTGVMRVPLMGVKKRLHGTKLASQLAFMMMSDIRRFGVGKYGGDTAEIGWILEDNKPMLSIAEALGGVRTRVYRIYEKAL